ERRAGPHEQLRDDQAVDVSLPSPAVLLRPCDADPASRRHLLGERAVVAGDPRVALGGEVGLLLFEERRRLFAHADLLIGEVDIHQSDCPPPLALTWASKNSKVRLHASSASGAE